MKGISIFLMAVLLVSCGSDAKQKEAEKTKEAQENLQKGLAEALGDLEGGTGNLQDALKNVADAVNNGEEVKVVNFREMKELLPNKIAGMELKDSEGNTSGAFGFTASTVTAKYANDDKSSIKIEMIDTGGMGKAFLGAVPWATMKVDKETKDGYERTTEYKGYKAFENFKTKSKRGTFAILVADRFVVTCEGRNVDMDDLKDAMDDIPLKKLMKLGE